MPKTVGIGYQDFSDLIREDCFYIDKTSFIKEWWNRKDVVTLITRPRRFGKTLTLSMVERFFSNRYDDQEELFGDLEIWKDEEMRALAGQFPVILLSFANVKDSTYESARKKICQLLTNLFNQHKYLLESDVLSPSDLIFWDSVGRTMEDDVAALSLFQLSDFLHRYYNRKVILLLDEYDTPMQEAYVNGYWEELVGFTRNLFNAGFKTNPSLGRGLMTGITRVSRESMFSDLNNLTVVTTTSEDYATAFGFTETEVFDALETYGYTDSDQEGVKDWYDGFVFGGVSDIYNPWSIINFLKNGKLAPYWINTSSNSLAGKLIREGDRNLKMALEDLLAGKSVTARIKEEVVFGELTGKSDSVFSLLMASGYIKPLSVQGRKYTVALTNYEVQEALEDMIRLWLADADVGFNDFVTALLQDDLRRMNTFMNEIALKTFSSFDSGNKPSEEKTPERFYHGFVLGMIIDLRDRFTITSNRESGFGRYDVVLEPLDRAADNAYIIEFKVQDEEPDLPATVRAALQQIEDRQYATDLITRGIAPDRIRKYGFAFRGKTVLIGEAE